MNVVVKPYLFIRETLGFKEDTLKLQDGSTVSDLLKILRSQKGLTDQIVTGHGKMTLFEGDQPTGMTILVGGQNIRKLQGTRTILSEGAIISLFPPAAGG